MSSAVTSYFVYCGEGGLSVQDTNDFIDAMSRQRMWVSHDGVKLHDLYVVTDEDSEQFYNEYINDFIPTGDWNGEWCLMEGFKYAYENVDDEHKAVFFTGRTRVHNCISQLSLQNIPERGSCALMRFPWSEERQQEVEDKMLFPVEQYDNWWSDDTEYSPYYFGIAASSASFFYKKFSADSDRIQSEYNNFQEWLEVELLEFVAHIPYPNGTNAVLHINDKAANKNLNLIWDENVRPSFTDGSNPFGWRGMGGEPEAKYVSYGHEYRDLTKQCSLVTFIGEEDPRIDEWLRLWIL
tara:strand:- start:1445 stop:2329 length:885 start_codon:yes stop_codon:yes gene_type:complete